MSDKTLKTRHEQVRNGLGKVSSLRDAADRVWEMAAEYTKSGDHDIAIILKDIASNLHYQARQEELGENISNVFQIEIPRRKK